MEQSRAVEAVNRTKVADGGLYTSTNLNPEQGSLGATFGAIMRNIREAAFGGVGFDINVSEGIAQIMSNPNNAIDIKGRTYYPHSSIGNLRPYNSDGNPAGGCFSLYMMG